MYFILERRWCEMPETLKNTDLMTLISIAQKDETKAEEIKKEIVKVVQDLNASINVKQKKLDNFDKKVMKLKFEMNSEKQTKEMYQNALKNFFE
jgi:peptidoglycan hydrolase CwlO-like protein